MMLLCLVLVLPYLANGFLTFHQRMGGSMNRLANPITRTNMASVTDVKAAFGSKFLPDISEEELQQLFKEFNITNFDINNDPEMDKWAPTKEFFETYGFMNTTERYQRKTMDVKIDFYSKYRKPILPQYKTFIADFLAMTHIQTVDARYKYDALHAFGLCTQYYTIMKGYPLQDEVSYSYQFCIYTPILLLCHTFCIHMPYTTYSIHILYSCCTFIYYVHTLLYCIPHKLRLNIYL